MKKSLILLSINIMIAIAGIIFVSFFWLPQGTNVLKNNLASLKTDSVVGDFQKGMEAYKKQDYAAALREWRVLAEQGDNNAQYALGRMYYYGQGVPRDTRQANYWFTRAKGK